MKTTTLFILLVLFMMPGCIVQDIHDQIALSNEKLQQIDESFEKVERANTALAKLDIQMERLQTLDSIDGNLVLMNERIDTLQKDLNAVSEHLASLRKTINNIDNTIPFLKISGDEEDEAAAEVSGVDEIPAAETTDPATPTKDPTK